MTAEIVDDVASVTPAWVTAAVTAGGVDAAVRAVTAERVGTGQMGSCYRLRVDYERGDGPDRLIVKLPATDPFSRAAGTLGYRCETTFYREVAQKLRVRIPRCYFAAVTDDGSAFTLLLEDLAPAQQGDQIGGSTVEQVRDAVVNITRLHGSTWCDPAIRELDWVIPSGPDTAEFTGAILKDATKSFVDRFSLTDDTVYVLNEFAERYAGWARGRTEPFSLVHNDYRLDNLLFAPPGAAMDPVVAVDWQCIIVGLPLRDVALLVATGLQTDDRRAGERDLVADYHQGLVDLGVDGYDFRRCWDDYRYALFHGPYISVLGALVAQPSERGDRMFTVMAERSATAIADLDALSLLDL